MSVTKWKIEGRVVFDNNTLWEAIKNICQGSEDDEVQGSAVCRTLINVQFTRYCSKSHVYVYKMHNWQQRVFPLFDCLYSARNK